MVKNLPAMWGNPGSIPGFRKISWRREGLPVPVFLLGEFYGQRSLVGYGPWGLTESDVTEQLSFHLALRMGFSLRPKNSKSTVIL